MGLAALLYPEETQPTLVNLGRRTSPRDKLTKLPTVRAPCPHIVIGPTSTCSFAGGNPLEELLLQMADLAWCRLNQLVCGAPLARLDDISELSESIQSPTYNFARTCQGKGMVLTKCDGHNRV